MDKLTKNAISATLHCLLGCAIGEVLGMVIGTALDLSNFATIVLAIVLAFFFGYSLAIFSLKRAGLTIRQAIPIALAADTASIASMEIIDNLILVAIPGAMDAGLSDWLFWVSLAVALAVAFVLTVPLNRFLIARGKGHAIAHAHHQHHDHSHHH